MRNIYHYESILAAVRGIAPDAHIAGGAVRDTIMERSIRDVDVFLHHENKDAVAAMLRSDFKYVKVGEWRQYELFSDPAIEGVAKFENADEAIPVALIALKKKRTVEENIARFDFGICMAAWEGNEIFCAPEFNIDLANKTFTLLRADNGEQFAYSMVRFNKLTRDRYAGWGLVVPERFKQLAKDHTFRRYWFYDVSDHACSVSQNVLRPKSRPQAVA